MSEALIVRLQKCILVSCKEKIVRLPKLNQFFGVKTKTATMSLENQLEVLAKCGLNLRQGITANHLLISLEREEIESKPFDLLMWTLGGDVEEEPYERISNDVWNVDTERIENGGDYAYIAHRIADMARDDLPLENVRDLVDWDNAQAWLSLSMDGEDYHWDFAFNDDWVDMEVFNHFQNLLVKRNSKRRLRIWDVDGGQAFLMICATDEQVNLLQEKAGLKFNIMSSDNFS
jgi:hypothetical protein